MLFLQPEAQGLALPRTGANPTVGREGMGSLLVTCLPPSLAGRGR